MVREDLPSTLLFGFCLLRLEPEDQGVSGSLKGLSKRWLAIGVSEGCPVSSLENTCLERSLSLILKGKLGAQRQVQLRR